MPGKIYYFESSRSSYACFWTVGGDRAPSENPYRRRENMQTPHRLSQSSSETQVLPAVRQRCLPYFCSTRISICSQNKNKNITMSPHLDLYWISTASQKIRQQLSTAGSIDLVSDIFFSLCFPLEVWLLVSAWATLTLFFTQHLPCPQSKNTYLGQPGDSCECEWCVCPVLMTHLWVENSYRCEFINDSMKVRWRVIYFHFHQ